MTVLRHLLLLLLAGLLSWFVLLRAPHDSSPNSGPEDLLQASNLELTVRPRIEEPAEPEGPESLDEVAPAPSEPEGALPEAAPETTPPAAVPELAQVQQPDPEEAVAAPPAPERGAPDGSEDGDQPPPTAEALEARVEEELAASEPSVEPLEESPKGTARAEFLEDSTLLATAKRELSGETRVGFETRILSAPEDQLEIARSFGGEIVLVPRAAIDPSKDPARAVWFRLRPAANGKADRVQRVVGPPELDHWTRYRDLFDYEYARLPEPVRDLRRSVLSRAEVFLFAGLISAQEWALVVGRRSEALRLAGRQPSELRRATLRTIRTAEGFDFRVESLEYENDSSN